MRISIVLLLCLIAGPYARSQSYHLLPDESTVRWTGRAAFSTYALQGNIDPVAGGLQIADERLVSAGITIDMTTLESDDYPRLTRHLKSKDFFHVSRFPKAVFKLTEPAVTDSPSFRGVFSIKAESREEETPLRIQRQEGRLLVTGIFRLDRTDYGVNFNSPSLFRNIKENAIADQFELEVTLVFKRTAEQ